MISEPKPMDICRRFRAAFTENFGKAIQWCTNRDAVWVEEPDMLHSLYLLHYGHTICPPVWRVQFNYVDPYPERSGWHTVKIGDTRYRLALATGLPCCDRYECSTSAIRGKAGNGGRCLRPFP